MLWLFLCLQQQIIYVLHIFNVHYVDLYRCIYIFTGIRTKGLYNRKRRNISFISPNKEILPEHEVPFLHSGHIPGHFCGAIYIYLTQEMVNFG